MIAHVTFDAYASAYEINGELYFLKSMQGVQSVRLLSKKDGEGPRYCLEITVEDDAVEAVKTEMEKTKSRYASEVSNFKLVTYSAI